MVVRSLPIGCLLVFFAAGCGDQSTGGVGTAPSDPSNPATSAATSAPTLTTTPTPTAVVTFTPTPLTSAQLERYRVELRRLMPEKRVLRSQGAAAPEGMDVVAVEGFDQVLMARRTAGGKTEHACVDTVNGAMEFIGASRRGETQ